MKKYCNTTFYNVILPVTLLVLMVTAAILWMITQVDFWIWLCLIICVSFKFIHHKLERLSIQQREDYGLVDSEGRLYPGSLSDADEREILRIKENWGDKSR